MKSDNSAADNAPKDHTPEDHKENPVEALQRRYADQLSQDIEQLEAEKDRLKAEIVSLRQDYATLHRQTRQLREANSLPTQPGSEQKPLASASPSEPRSDKSVPTERVPSLIGPRLPGEPPIEPLEKPRPLPSSDSVPPVIRGPELPTPATSERRKQRVVQQITDSTAMISVRRRSPRKGLILSAIATLLTAIHYGLVDAISQGGSWLGVTFGQLGVGFVPAVSLLWLRMLVIVPVLVLIAPQLYTDTWEDLQDWMYNREHLLVQLVCSGVALFFSQILFYQSIGIVGPAISTTLLFLYPLTAIPLGLGLKQERALSPLGLLAMVALAMGGLLVAKPIMTVSLPSLLLGLLASLSLSFYIVLTNLSYRQQCHPVPAAVVQFSTVATLSSVVLLVKPLQLASISWVSLFWWGVLIGFLMLLAYLFNYSSLRSIGPRTAMVAAATPAVVLLITWELMPARSLEIIQLTGILMVSVGGIALGKEKLSRPS